MHHCQINFLNASSMYRAGPSIKTHAASRARARRSTRTNSAAGMPVCVKHLQRRHQNGVKLREESKHGNTDFVNATPLKIPAPTLHRIAELHCATPEQLNVELLLRLALQPLPPIACPWACACARLCGGFVIGFAPSRKLLN